MKDALRFRQIENLSFTCSLWNWLSMGRSHTSARAAVRLEAERQCPSIHPVENQEWTLHFMLKSSIRSEEALFCMCSANACLRKAKIEIHCSAVKTCCFGNVNLCCFVERLYTAWIRDTCAVNLTVQPLFFPRSKMSWEFQSKFQCAVQSHAEKLNVGRCPCLWSWLWNVIFLVLMSTFGLFKNFAAAEFQVLPLSVKHEVVNWSQ